jgi:hypothetical protein
VRRGGPVTGFAPPKCDGWLYPGLKGGCPAQLAPSVGTASRNLERPARASPVRLWEIPTTPGREARAVTPHQLALAATDLTHRRRETSHG